MLSEPPGYWQRGQTRYSSCLNDNRGWETEEGRVFDVVGARGALCNLSASQRGGTLDADDGATLRLRRCAGGDPASCTWQDLLALKIEPNGGNRDVRWTNPDCAQVEAGDAIACQWTMDPRAAWEGGDKEAPELYVEFRSQAPGESFLPSNAVQGTSFQSLYCWSIAGGNEGTQTDPTEAQVPVPGEFTLTGWFATLASRPAADTRISLCRADGGGAAGCGGGASGSAIAACTVKATGPARCAQTGLTTRLAPGDRLFACTTRNDPNQVRAAAARLVNADNQWFLAASQSGVGVEVEFTRRGPNSVTMCNQWVPEDPQCMPQLVRPWTARAIRGWMRKPLSAGALDVSPRRNGRDADPRCTFTAGSQSCDATATQLFAADDFFDLQATPQNAQGGGAFGISILFDSSP